MIKKFLILSLLTIGLLSGNLALAQTEPAADTQVSTDITTEISVSSNGENTSADTSIAATNTASVKIPGAWGMFWKDLREKISLATTIDPVKKSELAITFAETRLQLAEAMAERAGDNPKLQERAQKMLEKADSLMQAVVDRKEEILQRKDERSQKLLERAGQQILRREMVIENLEIRLAPERLEALSQMRQEGLENGQRLLNAIGNENISPETRAHLQEVKQKIDAHLEETKQFLMEKRELFQKAQAGDEAARAELRVLHQERADIKTERREETKNLLQERKDIKTELRTEIRDVKQDLRSNAKEGDAAAKEKLKNINQIQRENQADKTDRMEQRQEIRQDIREKIQTNRTEP